MRLTDKQDLFCKYYALGMSGAEAVRQAGYEHKAPWVTAYDLLKKQHIKDTIEQYKEMGVVYDTIITENEVLQLLSKIARGEVKDKVMSPTGQVVTKEPDTNTRLKAMQELLKRWPDALKASQIQRNQIEANKQNPGTKIAIVMDNIKDLLIESGDDE
ncbi:terminase small subunit [Arthrobacter citreus]|nr:terminase small subunit [Arthrobacter citreus]